MEEKEFQSSLPAPPLHLINLYTDENVKKGIAPKPPPIPKSQQGRYEMFGKSYRPEDTTTFVHPLEKQGIPRLHPEEYDKRSELKKMNYSLVASYADLLENIIHSPESSLNQRKIDDIKLLFIHMHHLINEFRPHQARETIRIMMEVQKQETTDICTHFEKELALCISYIQQELDKYPESSEDLDDSFQLPMTKTGSVKQQIDWELKKPEILPEDQLMCDLVDSME